MNSNLKLDVQKLLFAAKIIRIITHPDRVKIIEMLEENEKLNVTEIYYKLNLSQAETSGQLGLLKNYGILNRKRVGKMSIYSLNKDALDNIIKVSEELSKRF
jgi:DNA-binding transcriptional ArsR family regulator